MKKTLSTFWELLFCVCCYAINGDGSAGNPYQIGNVDELYEFASIVNEGSVAANGVLTADIVVNNLQPDLFDGNYEGVKLWDPICGKLVYYDGLFDGNGHFWSCRQPKQRFVQFWICRILFGKVCD